MGEISIVNAKFIVENFSNKKFELSHELKLIIHNGSANIVIEENAEVAKNLLRVKAYDQLERAQIMNQNRQYDQAIRSLSFFMSELDKYKGDNVIDDIKRNI